MPSFDLGCSQNEMSLRFIMIKDLSCSGLIKGAINSEVARMFPSNVCLKDQKHRTNQGRVGQKSAEMLC